MQSEPNPSGINQVDARDKNGIKDLDTKDGRQDSPAVPPQTPCENSDFITGTVSLKKEDK